MSLAKARFLVNARGHRTGVVLTMEERQRAIEQLEELENFRLQGLVWVGVDRETSVFVDESTAAAEMAPDPHPARRIIGDAVEGCAKRYLTDERGKRLAVILSNRKYELACDALEDLEDIKAMQEVDEARRRGDPDTETLSFDEAFPEYVRQQG